MKLKAQRSALSRVLRGALYVKVGIVLAVIVGLGLLYARLSAGPLSFGRMPERIGEALASRIGPGWSVTMRNTALELKAGSPALRAIGLDVRDPNGALVVRAPYATVSVDGFSLLTGTLQPRSIELRDLQIRALVAKDGSLSFSPAAGGEGSETTSPAVVPQVATQEPSDPQASPVSRVVGSLFELVVGRFGILNLLDRAQLTNASLTLVDANQKQRGTFKRVDAVFEKNGSGEHHFDATLDGPQGVWQLNGDASGDYKTGYRATVVTADAPLEDVLLLAGMSALPTSTDLKLSGRIDAAYGAGRLRDLRARFTSNSGAILIDDKDTSPLQIDRSTIALAWEEEQHALALQTLEMKGGDTAVNLQGKLALPVNGDPWRLSLSGTNARLSGAAAGDAPVEVSSIEADLSGPDGVVLNSVKLRGPNLSADISGVLGSSADPHGLRLDLHATNSNLRSVLRVWPEAVAPPVRRFLVSNLKAGTLDSIALKVAMTGEDMKKAISGEPIPDQSLNIDFAISQGTLQAAAGLPPVSKMNVTGNVTGMKVMLHAPTGEVSLPEARSLAASDGTFVLGNYWDEAAIAQIDFRLQGGADALAALLREPLIQQIAGFDADPASTRGKTDLKVGIGLLVNNVPAFADLPLTVNGKVTDLTADKIFGKEKLEGAALTIAYDRGVLAIKGDGRIAGNPATIDVRKNREGGEANVALVLDDAARQRRGMSFGSQLTGPLPIKATMPLGKDASKQGIRLDADLTKANVDQLIPGWVKPAGRPGKLTLTLVEGHTSELRDLALDSGSTQLRGTAALGSDGSLERADLSTFKMSPGDDMRVQVDRAAGVYKVVVRGNVGDARPFTKSLSSSSPAPASNGRGSSRDVDLDIALNILTGYNDEAITNATIKASTRKDSLRQLDIKGRLGSTNVTSRTVAQGAGAAPVILLQAEDAGALLRFTDVYRRMSGGDLVLQMNTGDGPQPGVLTLRSFTLVNEPALRRIIPTQTRIVAGRDSTGQAQNVLVDTNRVDFAKARMDFTRTAGRIDFKDAAIWGNQIGFTLNGFIDYARDKMDISGTFIPAYGLNNAFAQVPLFGPLLGGGQYEGLFAVNFRASGATATPSLMVNPLSAVAPGFLRKLFGTGGTMEADSLPTMPAMPLDR
ncbi:DUF3971 domain-containing protein [Microvirga flavescens]|uniref:YhdP family protein n=1 Tax=Microvirga flavescens TaxID=2249811 RepID=UPI0013001BB9|nr:DUF3971 domain-containing protein [Microvirga flavescens]